MPRGHKIHPDSERLGGKEWRDRYKSNSLRLDKKLLCVRQPHSSSASLGLEQIWQRSDAEIWKWGSGATKIDRQVSKTYFYLVEAVEAQSAGHRELLSLDVCVTRRNWYCLGVHVMTIQARQRDLNLWRSPREKNRRDNRFKGGKPKYPTDQPPGGSCAW